MAFMWIYPNLIQPLFNEFKTLQVDAVGCHGQPISAITVPLMFRLICRFDIWLSYGFSHGFGRATSVSGFGAQRKDRGFGCRGRIMPDPCVAVADEGHSRHSHYICKWCKGEECPRTGA